MNGPEQRLRPPACRAALVIAFLPMVATAAGCVSTKAPEQTAVMRDLGVQVSAQRTRVAAHNFARGFMALVELTADSIAKLTEDPAVRHNTLVWKANAIPAIQVAMYHPDPLVSYADGWTLLVQMRQYFESGGGRDLFGKQQHVAVTSLLDAESEVGEAVAAIRVADAEGKVEAFVYRWAEDHPLTNDLYLRKSTTEAVADLLGAETGGGFSSLGSMTEMARDAQQMALVLASYTPKQIAWQSELLIADMADSAKVAPMLRAIDDMEVVSATADFMRITPELIAEERAAVFREIAEERLETFRDIDALRRQAVEDLAVLLAAERAAALREVGALVAAERASMMTDVAGLTSQAFEETRGLVNHLMLWIAALGLGLVVAVAALVVLLRRRAA